MNIIIDYIKRNLWTLAIFILVLGLILISGEHTLFLKHLAINFWNILIPVAIAVPLIQNKKLRDFVSSKPLACGFILIYVLALANLFYFNAKIRDTTINAISKTDSIGIEKKLPVYEKMNISRVNSLTNQVKVMQSRKREYLGIAGKYYFFMFCFSICLAVFSTLSTLIIVYIAKDGWSNDNKNVNLKIIFGICVVTSAISYTIPKTLSSDDNFKQNMGSYYLYDKQVIYTIQHLDRYTNKPDSGNLNRLDSTREKNYEFMKGAVNKYLDIDLTEATKDFKNVLKGGGNQ